MRQAEPPARGTPPRADAAPAGEAPGGAVPAGSAAAIADAAREGEPDRYLAALLAPRPQRDALLALAAFSAEVRRIALLVHEPAMGDIRRQWWRDALAMPAPLRIGHPVADALRAAAQAHALPGELLAGVIDAHACYPGNATPLSEAEVEAHLWGAEGALHALAAQVLAAPPGAETLEGCRAAGEAYGRVRLLNDLPLLLASARIAPAGTVLAGAGSTMEELRSQAGAAMIEALLGEQAVRIRDSLAPARRFALGLPRPARVAFLPLALVEPYLRALERSGGRFLREGAGVGPLARVSRIAAAHLLGRL
jgi:phytoene synthase